MSAHATTIFDKGLEEKEGDSDCEEKTCQVEEHFLSRRRKTWRRKVPFMLVLLLSCGALVALVVLPLYEISALKHGHDKQENEITDLKAELDDLRIRINSGNQIPHIAEDQENISELVAKISKISQEISHLDSLNSTQVGHDQMLLSIIIRLMELESVQNSTAGNIVRLEQDLRMNKLLLSSRLNETHQQLDVLASLLNSVSQSHRSHQVQISEIQRNITAIVNKQVQADNQLTSLESVHQSLSQEISSLQSDTSQLTKQLTDTKEQATDNKRKISETERSISSLQTDASHLKNQLSDTKGQVTDNKRKVSEAEGSISSLQFDTSHIKNQLSDTKGQVTDNKRKISEADGRISSLQSHSSQAQNDQSQAQSDQSQTQSEWGGIKHQVSNMLSIFNSGTNPVSSTHTYYFTIVAVIPFLV